MKETQKNNINRFIVFSISITLIVFSMVVNIDSKGESIVEDSLQSALKVFAVAKGLNAAISLAQGTEISPPGLTITIGEVLDPVNDLVEQFSWVMLASITSLGIQKILLNFVTGDLFSLCVIFSIVILNLWMFVRFYDDKRLREIFFKVTIVLIFLRFSIPIMSMLNSYMYETYVKQDYNIEKSQIFIEKSTHEINSITNDTIGDKQVANEDIEQKGFLDSLIQKVSQVFSIQYYQDKVKQYQEATEKTSKDIVNLIIAFSFQTIFFPLLFLFILYQLLRSVFRIGK
jgi:hypothetical protein